MTDVTDHKSFIHAFIDTEIPMEFVVKFDVVLQELVEVFEKRFNEESIREDYNNEWETEEYYTDAEIFAEKYSDF